MFFIMGFGHKRSQAIEIQDTTGRKYMIFFLYDYFSFFFIPLIRYGKQYYIATEGVEREITKEEYLGMRESFQVDSKFVVAPQSYHGKTYEDVNAKKDECANEYCPVCKNKLEKEHLYCPYCGQKQPVRTAPAN